MPRESTRRDRHQPVDQAEHARQPGQRQQRRQQQRDAARRAARGQTAQRFGRAAEHRAHDIGHDERSEQREDPVAAATAAFVAAMGADRLRQRFAVDQAGQLRGGVEDAAAVIAGAEFRRQILLDEAIGDGVGNRAFQSVTRLDAHAAVFLGHDQEHRVVHTFAPQLPLVEHALGVLLDGFGLGAGHHQHLQLAALALLQGQRLLFQLLFLFRAQCAGSVHHRRGQRRNRRRLLRPQRRANQRCGLQHDQREHPPQHAFQTPRSISWRARVRAVRPAERASPAAAACRNPRPALRKSAPRSPP